MNIADYLAKNTEIEIVPLDRKGGYDPLGSYGEWFWLPIIGPTPLWVYRRLNIKLDTFDHSYKQNLVELGREMGVVMPDQTHVKADSALIRAMVRLIGFGLAGYTSGTYSVRSLLPILSLTHYARLTPRLQELHDGYMEDALKGITDA